MRFQAFAWIVSIGFWQVLDSLANNMAWLNPIPWWPQRVCSSLGTTDFTEKKRICKHSLLPPTDEAALCLVRPLVHWLCIAGTDWKIFFKFSQWTTTCYQRPCKGPGLLLCTQKDQPSHIGMAKMKFNQGMSYHKLLDNTVHWFTRLLMHNHVQHIPGMALGQDSIPTPLT